MEFIGKKYNNKRLSITVKTKPEMYEAHDSGNRISANCSLEINDDGSDSNNDINKRCRRSKRTRGRNFHKYSDEDNIASELCDPSDNDGLLEEPSSSSPKGSIVKGMQMAVDDPLRQILTQMGLCDELYIFLKSSGITAQALKHMQSRHIDELFKGAHLNTKIIFEHRLKEWQEKTQSNKETCFLKEHNKKELSSSSLKSSFHQILCEADITNLSNLLTNAVQQTINLVLHEFKENLHKQTSDKVLNYNKNSTNELPAEPIQLKNIKTETNKGVDNKGVGPETPKQSLKTSQKIFKVSDDILLANQAVNIAMSPVVKKRKVVDKTNVEEILTKSAICRNFLDEYKKNGFLTTSQQTEIVRFIVDFHIRNNMSISTDGCKDIANELVALFPTESLETYFYQIDLTKSPKGKIWQQYEDRIRSTRKPTGFNSIQKPSKMQNLINGKVDWTNTQMICSQMKHINNEAEFFEKWKESFAFRRHQLETAYFSNWKLFFDEYPFCKQHNYAQYFEYDLRTLYPNLKFNEVLWDEFLENFPAVFKNRIQRKKLYDQLTSLGNLNTFSDYVAIKVFELLHEVLKSYTNVQTKQDVQLKFNIEVKDLFNLKKVVIERKKYCNENNIQAKPYIAIVGENKNYSSFSVILDSTGFSCDSYKESLVLCFNLYLFFGISFPHEYLNVWTFVQKYFFNKPPSIGNLSVDAFINDINNAKAIKSDMQIIIDDVQ